MVVVNQVRAAWSGFNGGPGVSTFYFDDGTTPPLAALRSWFEAWKPYIKDTVTITYPGSGLKYDAATGAAVGTWSQTPPANTVCTGAAGYAAMAGAVCNWLTGVYAGGRQIRGKTFLVPLAAPAAFDANGTLLDSLVTATNTATNTFLTAAPNFRIWSRQNLQAPPVVSGKTSDRAIYLTSRRP